MAKWRNTTQKPPLGARIDWSNPITKGLELCFVLNENGGGVINDLAKGYNGLFYNNVLWSSFGLFFDGSSYVETLPFLMPNNSFSIVTKTKYTGATSGRTLISKDSLNTTTDIFSLYRSGATGYMTISIINTNNSTYSASDTIKVPSTITDWATIYDEENTSLKLYRNAEIKGITTTSGTLKNHNSTVRISDTNWLGDVFYFYLFSRALSDDEIKLLHYEPYSFFEVPSMRTVVAFGGGPITATPEGAYHEHYAESPTVTVTVIVTPAETYHEHYADNVTATTYGAVTVDETYHEHYADVVPAQRLTSATADEAYHEHYADNVTASVGGVIDPQETYHEHYADEVQATVTVNAPVDETYHLHITDSVYVPDSGYRKKLVFNPFTGTFDYIAIPE